MQRLFVVAVLAICFATPAYAASLDQSPRDNWVVYAGDVLAARPFTLGITVVGAAIYVATLPFTYFSHDPTVFNVLVKEPAAATFTRCVGCTVLEADKRRPSH